MKIAIFVHCFFPAHFFGTETYTLDLARNLRLLGHEPVVVTAVFPGEPRQDTLIRHYEHEGVEVVSIDKNRMPDTCVRDTYYQSGMAPVFDALLDEIAPEVVHVTHLVNHTAVLLEVLARRGLPVIATFTDFFGFCYTNRLEAVDGSLCAGPATPAINCIACRLKAGAMQSTAPHSMALRHPLGAVAAARLLYAFQSLPGRGRGKVGQIAQDVLQRPNFLMSLYRHYHHAIVPTAFIGNAYERNGFAGALTRVPFGVDIARAPKIHRVGGPLVLGFVGQIMEHKGPDLLVEAARQALRPENYEIRIFGSEHQHPAYTARLKETADGLPVKFMGTFQANRMREVMDELDVLVIPSRWYENSPLVMLNALASHTPVIVSDVDGMTEFVRDGVNGFTFARGDADSLANVLRRIDADRGRLHALSAATSYDVTTFAMTQQTLEIYRQAAKRPRSTC
ncbi:MAG: glycosyltransferase family 4 protein [Burkholderiaceae bacterium]